jgi:phytoene dehydrogenase-like protein
VAIEVAKQVTVSSKSAEVLIVGAGLAGLGAALELEANGVDVLVIESTDRAGGRVASDVIDGFICDRGFQLINSRYPALVALDVVDELDFIEAPRVIEVSLGDRRHPIGDPRQVPWTILDKATGSIPEKIALLLFLLRDAKQDQSIGQALRMTGATYERVLRPFLHGVFLTDPDNVDVRYGRSIIKSFVNGKPGIPRNGVGELPKALVNRLSNIVYNTPIDRLDATSVYTTNGVYSAQKILIATDATTATQLLGLPEVPRMTGCITWYHSASTNPSGNGRLVVDGQNRGPIINTVVISDVSSNYAPHGAHLISTTTDLTATESDVRRHLSVVWGTSTHEWQLIAKYEIPAALPIQSIGRPLSQVIKINEHHFVAGDHRAVPSQQGALFSGRLAAQLILN